MNYKVPSYIEERILAIRPDNMSIVKGSTPVVAFGNPQKAQIATLGLNPSKLEFLDSNGIQLTGNKRRLETLDSLGTRNISELHSKQIWEGCNNYFNNRPYRRWFNPLEKILKHFEVSYYSSTACHLDLVQWATDPVWSKLSEPVRQTLCLQDKNFLAQQLANESIEILLLNGSSVVNEFQKAFECQLTDYIRLEENRLTARICKGYLFERIKVIGWSINLQSSFGVTNTFIKKIAKAIIEI